MKSTIIQSLVMCSVVISASSQAATFYTRNTQGQVNTWASIWTNDTQTTAVAPTAGNTYEAVFNGTSFGSTATGAGVNNTRIRNPYGSGAVGGVQTFPGDSLTLNVDTEFRFKNDNITLTSVNFPGVGGSPGLILNGGALNAGNDFVFPIDGRIQVTANSVIIPADNGAGAMLQLRGFNILGSLSGNGSLYVCQAGTTVAQQVSSTFNSYSGEWIVKAGWLQGTGIGSLGAGNITIDPLASVPITTLSTLSNGPAQLELMYDIVTPSRLTLRNGGQMVLHQNCTFASASIEGTDLTTGLHSFAELAAAFPSSFVPGGSGSIRVGRIVTVNTVNNETPGAGETSLLQALNGLQAGDVIRFAIPGAGPHVIVTPIGGYPLITANDVIIDGYTQPGSAPNTNSILGGNNAQIKIVLDSTGAEAGENPIDPNLPLRRSTRLDFPNDVGNTGYGTSENAMLGIYQADNVIVRGLSFIARRTPGTDNDPSIYAVALIREATNARVQGCWFGLAPGAGTTFADVKPPSSAVAAYRWRIGGDIYSGGAIIGTDGDGIGDRAEFNVIVGGRISLALELPGPKIAGNYVNLFPDGLTFLDIDESYQAWVDVYSVDPDADPGDVTIENWENGRVADNTIVGTDGNGVSDSDERNIFGHPAYDVHGEFYGQSTNVVIAGNYFGVAVDGITRAPVSTNIAPDFVTMQTASVRVGSNGDGMSDSLEGNVLVKCEGSVYVRAGASVPISSRLNTLEDNGFTGIPFADGQNGRVYTTYYAPAVTDANAIVPVLSRLTNGVLYGSFAAPSAEYPNAVIDIYTVDPAAVANTNSVWPSARIHPLRWLAGYVDNTTNDLDSVPNLFAFDLTPFALASNTLVTVSVTYSKDTVGSAAGNALTSPMSNPVSERPVLHFFRPAADQFVLWWLGGPNQYFLQVNPSFDPNNWLEIFDGVTYQGGRTTASQPIFFNDLTEFYRLISQ